MSEHQTPTASIVIPFGQALITGLLGGIVAGIFAGSFRTGLIVGVAAALVTWLVGVIWWRGLVEPPRAQPVHTMSLVVRENNGHTLRPIGDFDPELLVKVAVALLDGAAFSTEGIGRLFDSRREFVEFRDIMISKSLARWRHPAAHQQGIELTSKGRAVMRGLSGDQDEEPPRAALSPSEGWKEINRK